MRAWVSKVAVAALLVGAVVLVVSWLVETDGERIESLVEEMRRAALDGDVDGVLAGVAEDATFEGGDVERMRREVRQVLENRPPKAISASVESLEVEDDRATGVVEVVYRTEKFPSTALQRLRVTFVKRNDRWAVASAERR